MGRFSRRFRKGGISAGILKSMNMREIMSTIPQSALVGFPLYEQIYEKDEQYSLPYPVLFHGHDEEH